MINNTVPVGLGKLYHVTDTTPEPGDSTSSSTTVLPSSTGGSTLGYDGVVTDLTLPGKAKGQAIIYPRAVSSSSRNST